MKHLNVAALALLLVLTSGYVLRNYDGLNEKTYEVKAGPPPTPTLKPKAWAAYEAGRLRRLSMHSFGTIHQDSAKARAQRASASLTNAAPTPAPVQGLPVINFSPEIDGSASLIKLDVPHGYDPIDFTETLAGLAQDSPIQPQKHPCAASSKSIKSLGMKRQITQSASLGVEYVYKEKCHSKTMSALSAEKLPDETGVKLRLNMRF